MSAKQSRRKDQESKGDGGGRWHLQNDGVAGISAGRMGSRRDPQKGWGWDVGAGSIHATIKGKESSVGRLWGAGSVHRVMGARFKLWGMGGQAASWE